MIKIDLFIYLNNLQGSFEGFLFCAISISVVATFVRHVQLACERKTCQTHNLHTTQDKTSSLPATDRELFKLLLSWIWPNPHFESDSKIRYQDGFSSPFIQTYWSDAIKTTAQRRRFHAACVLVTEEPFRPVQTDSCHCEMFKIPFGASHRYTIVYFTGFRHFNS